MPSPQKISITSFPLYELESALDDNSFLIQWYIDLQENKVTFLSDSFDDDKELVELIESDTKGERFIPIPPGMSREGYAQMERFIYQVKDEKIQRILNKAIDVRGAFSRYRDVLYDLNLEDDWHEFKGREDRKNALDWLFREDLISKDDIYKGMQMYENDVTRRKRRKTNLAKMVKGAIVVYSGNNSHVNQVTPGQTYQVLDEQKQQLNIQIKDNRGKITWIPKAHFELVTEA